MLQTASAFPRAGTIALLSAVAVIGVLPLRLVAAPAAEPQATSRYAYVTSTDADRAFVRIDGGHSGIVMSGSTDEVALARRSIGTQGNALWVRQGEARYVIRDRDLLQRFDALFDPVTRLGQQQGELGNRQGELGAQQGRLGLEQGELGQQQARIALDAARRALDGERTPESATARREQAELQARQQALSEQQRELGRQQGALGERQREASARAHAGAWQLFDEALSNRLAERVDH